MLVLLWVEIVESEDSPSLSKSGFLCIKRLEVKRIKDKNPAKYFPCRVKNSLGGLKRLFQGIFRCGLGKGGLSGFHGL